MELGDNGYRVNPTNTVVITAWDNQVPDYWPSMAANVADRQWLVSAILATGTIGRMITGSAGGGGGGDLVQNGTFASGMTNWSVFAQPQPTA